MLLHINCIKKVNEIIFFRKKYRYTNLKVVMIGIFRCHPQRRGLVDERPSWIATRRLRHNVRRPDLRRLQHVRHRHEVIRTSDRPLSLDGAPLLKPPRTGMTASGVATTNKDPANLWCCSGIV